MNLFKVIFDVSEPWQMTLQDPASPIMVEIISLHDKIMFYIVVIIVGVSWALFSIVYKFNVSKRLISHKYLVHGTLIEIVWTIMPAVVLVAIAFPSFKLLYLMDEIVDPGLTIKAIGRQWYWVYEYSDYVGESSETLSFDSYMVPTDDLEEGDIRLLEVDNQVVLPVNTQVRVVVTASDVLHCWAVPSLGVKMDAVPGRLNQTGFLITRLGIYYGACSEICGTGHGYMPIVVKGVSMEDYLEWITSMLEEE